jgi:glycosyltransferase involved in cell wall biosynthesis
MISVVVPVFNSAPYLERTIAALEHQDYPRDGYELIFVDNGSDDGGLELIERQAGIRILRAPSRGSYAARNHGVRASRGEVLAFTDADCFPAAGWLRAIESALQTASIEIVLGPRTPPAGGRALRLIAEYENRKVEQVCASSDPRLYFGHTNNMAVRRRAMDRFGPFVERARGADTVFVRRVVDGLSCEAVAYASAMLVEHAELDSVAAYYRKVGIYGRSRQAYRHLTTVRPLNQAERLRAFWAATRCQPLVDTALLLLLLAGGSLAWWYGGFRVPASDA